MCDSVALDIHVVYCGVLYDSSSNLDRTIKICINILFSSDII